MWQINIKKSRFCDVNFYIIVFTSLPARNKTRNFAIKWQLFCVTISTGAHSAEGFVADELPTALNYL